MIENRKEPAHDTAGQIPSQITHETELAKNPTPYAELLLAEQEAHSLAKTAIAEAQLYAEVVRNMQVGLYIWQIEDIDDVESWKIIATNPAATEMTGVPIESILGKTLSESFPDLVNTEMPRLYAQVRRTGEPVDLGEVHYEDQRVDKSVFAVKAFPLTGNCVGVAFENITQRKRIEAAHREQEAQLLVIFQQAGVGIARLLPDGRWLQVNQRLCDIFCYSMDELLQTNFLDLTHGDDRATSQAAIHRLISSASSSGDRSQQAFEKRYVTRQGEVIWAEVTVSAVRDTEDRVMYLIATVQDTTARQTATLELQRQKDNLLTVNNLLKGTMQTLRQRNQELDQFAYVTSHDLKAPLRAIANLATWIEEDIGHDMPDENKEQFGLLKSRVHRMEGLIDGLLEYSRIGRTHQSHERVDVAEILNDIVDSLSPLNEFTVEIEAPMPVLEAKKVPLIQVFSNLIGNAIKHHDRADGTVRVSAKDAGDFYEFAIADDGPGIDPAYHEKVFAIFQTLRSRDDLESTGIGLSLVKKIVAAEGGQVSLCSDVGQGAVFRVTWPKSPRQQEPNV
ncbi:MAG: PAS domain S-box protein [Phormidesmis sp. RL_2_1]|nr:PAS domain S-box protein [Phormidesmis sp. RL_2_1]